METFLIESPLFSECESVGSSNLDLGFEYVERLRVDVVLRRVIFISGEEDEMGGGCCSIWVLLEMERTTSLLVVRDLFMSWMLISIFTYAIFFCSCAMWTCFYFHQPKGPKPMINPHIEASSSSS